MSLDFPLNEQNPCVQGSHEMPLKQCLCLHLDDPQTVPLKLSLHLRLLRAQHLHKDTLTAAQNPVPSRQMYSPDPYTDRHTAQATCAIQAPNEDISFSILGNSKELPSSLDSCHPTSSSLFFLSPGQLSPYNSQACLLPLAQETT